MENTLQEKLAAPFANADIEWRLQRSDDTAGTGIAVPYVTNRAIQNRLDQVVGVDKWKNEYIPWHHDGEKASQICGISIYFEERQEWVTKYDGAENSAIESVKGGLSDSMKRAAVQWSIGRYIYGMDGVFVNTEKRGKSTVIKKSEYSKLNQAHSGHVAKVFGKAPDIVPEPQKQQQQKPVAVPPPTTGKQPLKQGEYEVLQTAIQNNIKSGKNTHIQLKGIDGKTIQVLLKGENPAIVSGARIMDAKITEKVKEGVRFLILNDFQLVEQAAA